MTIRVVVRYVHQLRAWFICHEESYQNAFPSSVNGFETKEDARWFAIDHGCTVVHHSFDQLQDG